MSESLLHAVLSLVPFPVISHSYFASSTVEEAEYELPGIQERVYCTVSADMPADDVTADIPADVQANTATGAKGVDFAAEDNAGVFSGPGVYLFASAVALVPYLYL